MKKIWLSVLIGAFLFTACSGSGTKNEKENHDMGSMKMDSASSASVTNDRDIKVVAVTFPNVDAKAFASVKEIVGHYLHIKNALANDNGKEAANAAKGMERAIRKLDKSLFTAEQKLAYDKNEEELNEDVEHIGRNGDKIAHQREHFAELSEVVYELVRNFGAGQALYHDHCPMAKNNQGAMWISEMKEIKNPYLGNQMPTCGIVKEVFK